MGLLRKTLLLSTGGLAPVKANSKKERIAKATEKQVRLQQQALRATQRPPVAHAPAVAASGLDSPGRMARAARREARERTERGQRQAAEANAVASELERLAALHRGGALTDQEFAAAKANILGG